MSEAFKTMDKAEMGKVIIEFNQAMMDSQQEKQELIDENRHLHTENHERKLKSKCIINLEHGRII